MHARQNYKKIVLSVLTVLILTTSVLSSILYLNFERIATGQLYDSTIEQLNLIRQNAAIMKNSSHALSKQLYSDQFITQLLHYSEPQVADLTQALTQLNYYRLTMPYITSIYIYNRTNHTFYTAANFESANSVLKEEEIADKQIVEIVNGAMDISRPVPRSLSFEGLHVEKSENYYTFLYFDTLLEADSIVVLNISELWMNQIISGTLSRRESNIFIIDEHGTLVSDTWKKPMMTSLKNEPYIQSILAGEQTSYLTREVDGVTSLIAFTDPDPDGWRYIKITPYNTVMKDINRMKRNTLAIVLAIVVAVLLVSMIMSRRLYKPFERLTSRLTQLETEKRNSLAILRNDVLSSLISDHQFPGGRELRERIASCQIRLDTSGTFIVVLLRIDRYIEFLDLNSSEARRLYKYAIQNIGCELFGKYGNCEALDTGEDRVVVIWQLSGDTAEDLTQLAASTAEEAIHAIRNYLKLSVSCAISACRETISDIPELYRQAQEVSAYRLVRGYNSVITSRDVARFNERTFHYPEEKELRLVDALMMSRTADAIGIYDEIIDEVSQYSYEAIHLAISRLSFAVGEALRTIYRNNFKNEDMPKLMIDLNHTDVLEQINARFYEAFQQVASRLADKKSSRHQDTIDKTLALIEREYTNPDLTIDMIAEELGLSTKYLSRLFKQMTGKTMMESVNALRLGKAQELLRTTADPVVDIAIATGYTSGSYFHKIFKKECGVTPTDFRKNAAEPGEGAHSGTGS